MEWEEYKGKVNRALDAFEFDDEILHILKESKQNNQRIFVGGNGGSAALALHYVCDLSKGANKNWETNTVRYKAICLSSNSSYISAIANDSHFDEVFKQQLVNLASANDILILISSSGSSPNIVKALDYAKDIGMITIGVCGFGGGKLKEHAHYTAHINENLYEVCEDIHAVFGHFLATWLRKNG